MKKIYRLSQNIRGCYMYYAGITVMSPSAVQDAAGATNALPVNATSVGNMGGDNWWLITLESYGSLTVDTESDETLYLFLYLYDISMNLLSSSERFEKKQQHVEHLYLAPGQYYIKTVPKDLTSGAYTITTAFVPSTYINENYCDNDPVNDVKEHAYMVTPEITYTGQYRLL